MAEWGYSLVHSEPWDKMNIYRQLCILATSCPREKNSKVPMKKRLGEPQVIWML